MHRAPGRHKKTVRIKHADGGISTYLKPARRDSSLLAYGARDRSQERRSFFITNVPCIPHTSKTFFVLLRETLLGRFPDRAPTPPKFFQRLVRAFYSSRLPGRAK